MTREHFQFTQHSRAELEMDTQRIGTLVQHQLADGVGFALILFDVESPDGGGNVAYLANADRESMVAMLNELLERLTTPPTPDDRALGGDWTPEGVKQ